MVNAGRVTHCLGFKSMISLFANQRILLGVTGSIAAYKTAALASQLTQAGAHVDTILTQAGENFVSALTFQSLTGRGAYTDSDLWSGQTHIQHIDLAEAADLMVIAPATANTLAKLAHGQADNLLTISALARRCPLIVAPAMDGGMWSNAATQANITKLKELGIQIAGPAAGHLASGLSDSGRMLESEILFGHIRHALSKGGPLAGRKIVVTAGGTQESLDPVRFLTNHSTGKQGFALAQAALDLGAKVVLITTSLQQPVPAGAQLLQVRTAQEMLNAVLAEIDGCDILIMAAAVADFRPTTIQEHKIKKGAEIASIQLEKTQDILKSVTIQKETSGFPCKTIGFAAESQDLISNAQAKLRAKDLDMIVVNDIRAHDAGFGVDTNRVTLLCADGFQETLPLMSKVEVAEAILRRATLWE
jgi:phosphopantothenoylcysteine decarboxylase/phosphopantothenate--cysteine ligase